MNRCIFLLRGLLASSLIVLSSSGHFISAQDSLPNIIYLMSDDQRWGNFGCYGNPEFNTPNIDKLAEEGILLENCFYCASICMASRASIMTGQYLSRHRCDFRRPTDYSISKQEFSMTYPVLLREAGYRTGFIGKFGFVVSEEKERGKQAPWGILEDQQLEFFDYWRSWGGQAPEGEYWPVEYGRDVTPGSSPHLTDILGDLMIDFIDSNPEGKPFCLSVSFHAPKGALKPLDVKPEYAEPFQNTKFNFPGNYVAGDNENLPYVIQKYWRGYLRYHPKYTYTPAMYQEFVRRQAGLGYGIDIQVGKLVDKLKEEGLLNNTLIIYTSDNGFFNGSHGLDGKFLLYEESVRAPLIVFDGRLPEGKRGRRLEQLISTVDYAPTILQLAGVSVPETMQGQSFVPLIVGKNKKGREMIFMENNFTGLTIPGIEETDDPEEIQKIQEMSVRCRGIRTERWKYIRFHELNPVLEQLFDLENDPFEQNNLANDPAYEKTLIGLRGKCEKYYQKIKFN